MLKKQTRLQEKKETLDKDIKSSLDYISSQETIRKKWMEKLSQLAEGVVQKLDVVALLVTDPPRANFPLHPLGKIHPLLHHHFTLL